MRPTDPAAITLPEELRASLSPREHRLLAALISGEAMETALQSAGYRKRTPAYAKLRDLGLPTNLRRALQCLIGQLYEQAGKNRNWIRAELVKTYECAANAVPILDNRGLPTGEYRVDGATRTRALQLLGSDIGMFSQRVTHDLSGDVKALLAAVAERGKPRLEARRPAVTLDQEPTIAAPQQIAPTNPTT